jgi:hypothetical protein
LQWLLVALILPLIFAKLVYNHFDPYELRGPGFLGFYAMLLIGSLTVFWMYHRQQKQGVLAYLNENFPTGYTVYHAAYFLYGRPRAIQTAIVDALKKDVIELRSDNTFWVKNDFNYPGSTNPLFPLIEKHANQYISYDEIDELLKHSSWFHHPVLDQLHGVAYKRNYLQVIFVVPVLILFITRAIQAALNDKPILFLVIMSIIVGFVFYAVAFYHCTKSTVYDYAKEKFEQEPLANMQLNSIDEILRAHAINGTPAIAGFSEFAALSLMFGSYPLANHIVNRSGTWIGASCSGSSDGCGSGGGSSCGGGGCGGCGGGD